MPWHNRVEQFKYSTMFENPEQQLDFHWYNDPSTSYHNHNYFEFNLITKGSCLYRLEKQSFTLNQKDLVFITPGNYHQIAPNQKSEVQLINISATESMLTDLASSFSPFLLEKLQKNYQTKISLTDAEYNYLFSLINENVLLDQDSYNYSLFIKNWLHSALLLLYKYYRNESFNYPSWFNDILSELSTPEFLEMKLYDTPLARRYSATSLNKYFRQYLNTTPNQYFTSLKMEYAGQLLKKTNYSILMIAQKIGFDSLSYFTRFFKQTYGVTPSEYRKKRTPPPISNLESNGEKTE